MQWPISVAIPRVALVTGGAARLGRALAQTLAEQGFAVGLHYRGAETEARVTLAEIEAKGGRGCLVQADLSVEAETAVLVDQVTRQLGPVGVLVNNASRFERDEWSDTTRDDWDAHMEPNLRAPFVLTQAFARALPAEAEGVVINMLDERVWSLTPHFVTYTVSKAALWTLTQTMALALAPRRIRVNGIGPGPALPSPRQSAEQFARQCASVPLGQGTSPTEVARAAMAILSLPSMTGQMIALDGGQHLQWSPAVSPIEE
ncbi:short chain dehydrogenase [Ameyamaea chiangmaiensis NBRC 103196]|uniref:SDR family oxidoreductase n=1 Tax=Ameyamaea chiangmaiensis TaxID=442969 RepID=A0A850PD62_9PROT|nr:SDR family oxidoreductase [Ameyamaea chiangmaiensis]MBS4075916.1 SDR family oxidoreductase [Ameyamaea chiangmaiensis]NVN40599.1 SDR family oxidoreductase [Ameyamaea chiangmaiensis]GBQ61742.1 short chain dehydrogenase [Ameyamaea chiangmaiensis NBRC 103196]